LVHGCYASPCLLSRGVFLLKLFSYSYAPWHDTIPVSMEHFMSMDISPAVLAAMPLRAKEFARIIGLDRTLALVKALGGCDVQFTKGARDGMHHQMIAAVIGTRATKALWEAFGDGYTYIPLCSAARLVQRNIRMHAEFDRALDKGYTASRSVAKLAVKYQLSDRHIWRIMGISYA